MPDLSDEIETAAAEPQSAAGDGQSATSHSLPDLIAADQYLAKKAAATAAGSPFALLRAARVVPPGAGPGC